MELLSAVKNSSWLSWFMRGLMILTFLVLTTRLLELQIIKGNHFRALAESNRIRKVTILAPRGKILARGGEILVGNREVKRRVIFNPEKGYTKVDNLAGAEDDEIITETVRDYKLGSKFAHVGGYVGEVSEDGVGRVRPDCTQKGPRLPGSMVGKTGLEEQYDCILAGVDGEELVEVDTSGKKVRTLGRREPIPGADIKTSIDLGLQEKLAQVMEGKPGAIVVTDPRGEVLALYSSPSFDPNVLVSGEAEAIAKILTDTSLPLFNRAIGGAYHPGSVFKPIVAIAGLQQKKIDENYTYTDTGVVEVNNYTYTNWYLTQYGRTEGTINLVRAIARSTDTFFYKLGEFVGIRDLGKWAHTFGLGEKTGIDLPGEVAGLVPSPEWKKETKGEAWFLGNTYHVSIGQGDLAASPIQINAEIAAIAGGAKCKPTIVGLPTCQKLSVEEKNLALVREGMTQACAEGGTGFPFFDFEPNVACKTGTAETGKQNVTHAWFTVFAPTHGLEAEIVATVLVEEGGEGSTTAGPIARKIFDYWYGKSTQN